MAYSKDFRNSVIEYIQSGHTQVEAAHIFGVTTKTIRVWLALHKESGSAGGGYSKNTNRPFRKIDTAKLDAFMKEHPQSFLREIAEEFSCCIEGVRKALKRLNYTKKKS